LRLASTATPPVDPGVAGTNATGDAVDLDQDYADQHLKRNAMTRGV
jgi:hypothetical protein